MPGAKSFRDFMNDMKYVRLEIRRCRELLEKVADAEDVNSVHGVWDDILKVKKSLDEYLPALKVQIA